MNRSFYSIGIAWLLISCTGSLNNQQEILQYVGNKSNGLVQERRIEDLIFTLKYMPPEYFMFLENIEGIKKEEALANYRNGISFLLSVFPAEKFGNILYRGINNEGNLRARIEFLNFQFGTLLELKYGEESIPSSLCVLENAYNLDDGLRFLVVFEKNDVNMTAESLDVRLIDLVFKTGIHHFNFNKNDIDNIPIINL